MLHTASGVRELLPTLLQQGRQKYGNYESYALVRISDTLAIKKSSWNSLTEAATLRYIRENTTIPVPTVHDAWQTPGPDGGAYILMGWIGDPDVRRLKDYWKSLTDLQKEKIATQLRGFLHQLRSLPQPAHMQGYIGPPDGSTIFDTRLRSQPCGPFASEAAFNDFLVSRVQQFMWHPPTRAHIEQVQSRLRDDHSIVFTHGDINDRNILIDRDGNIAGLIDWEMSGWMPEYWEHLKCDFGHWHEPEWLAFYPTFVRCYEAERENDNQFMRISGAPF
jgi:aminoglycoside phosphotransferase (APT) family kinase protein